jgi:predicted phage baseplate assembly protein
VLPEIMLDDVRFQELVSEARTRIVRHSPEWTEHNVSDPGITLIELFAWLTEILSYRINRIPERLHLALLELVGVRPAAPQQAHVDLRFLLAGSGGAAIPAGTEVASPRTADGELIVFQTDEELTIPVAHLSAYAIERGGQMTAVPVKDGVAEPAAAAAQPFGSPPVLDDALLFGFEEAIAGLVVRLEIDCSRAQARHPDATEPMLTWESPGSDGEWYPATVVGDETGAFLLGGGAITVEVPTEAAPVKLTGKAMHWLRCRVIPRGEAGSGTRYTQGPSVSSVRAEVVGGVVGAHHAATVLEELIGSSEGIPGTSYRLQHRPVLALGPGEHLEVRERGSDAWEAWRPVESFAMSVPGDRHFQLDQATGELRFGPAIRQPDGGWRHYGAVPSDGAALRFSRYRWGGGASGNVAPRTLSVIVPRLPGVASATNPRPASGGVDAELLESARERARLEIRGRSRAVTAEDFERLTLAASPDVARAICTPVQAGGAVRVHVLPRVEPADRRLEVEELTPSESLMETVAAALDRRRLLGTSIRLLPVRFKGVSVVVDVRASPRADLERVQQDVEHALYVYLNPLIGGNPTGHGEGWPCGRALNPGELFGIVYAIEGVEFVNILRMYETDVATGQQAPQQTDSRLELAPDELIVSGRHIVKAVHKE